MNEHKPESFFRAYYLTLYLRRSANFLYYCNAVKQVDIDIQGRTSTIWQIDLHPGNDPRWLLSHQKHLFGEILQERQKAGFWSPESIVINAPGFDIIPPIKLKNI